MMMRLIISLAFFVGTTVSIGIRYRGSTVYHTTLETSKAVDTSNVTEAYVEQSLNWFDALDLRTYAQRYFVDEKTYWSRGADAPVFLCVGGEGPPLDKTVLVASSHCNDMIEYLAPKHGALLLSIEHR